MWRQRDDIFCHTHLLKSFTFWRNSWKRPLDLPFGDPCRVYVCGSFVHIISTLRIIENNLSTPSWRTAFRSKSPATLPLCQANWFPNSSPTQQYNPGPYYATLNQTTHDEVYIEPPTPRTEAAQKKRPKYTRSKTGCLTCRVKKIKVNSDVSISARINLNSRIAVRRDEAQLHALLAWTTKCECL
jgi:hypothetical protein